MAYPLYLTVRPLPTSAEIPVLRALLEKAFPLAENAFYFDALCASSLSRVTAARLGALTLLPALLTHAGIPSHSLLLRRDGNGRPYCTLADGSCPGFDFNLSHSDAHAAAALLIGDRKVGVDVEELIPPSRALPMIRRFCTEGELALLRSIPDDHGLAAGFFTSTWVEREALAKQDGVGGPLRFDTTRIPDGVQLWSGHLPDTDTRIALCAPLKLAPALPRVLPDSLSVSFP